MAEFKLDLDGATNVILGDEFEMDCNKLRLGYILASKTLIRAALDNPLSDGYHLIYPILYCFRHYLELELKYFYSQFNGEWPNGHFLKTEWYEVIKVNYKKIFGYSVPDQVKEYMEIYNQLDPRGDYFKYEIDTKDNSFRKDTFDKGGKKIKWGDPCHVGLQSMKNDIEIIECAFLELRDSL